MQAQWIRHGTNIPKVLNAFQGLVNVMICHNLHNMSILKGPDECVMQKGWSTRARPHLLERFLTQTVMRSVWKKKPNPLVHQNNIWSWDISWSSVTQLIYFWPFGLGHYSIINMISLQNDVYLIWYALILNTGFGSQSQKLFWKQHFLALHFYHLVFSKIFFMVSK